MKQLSFFSHNAHGMFVRLFLFFVLMMPVAWAQTVAAPTFLPVSGTSLTKFPVIVSCATPGATIRYSVTGAEPTLYDPVVVSGQSVVVAQNMTLKAKAFDGANTSITASTTFDLTGDVSGGSQFLLALVSNGKVYGWGNQDFGRLSNNSTANTNILAPAVAKYSSAVNINDATRVAAGAKHSIMLDAAGNVWGFGNNLLGESGRTTPAEVRYAAKITSNSGGTTFLTTCAKVAAGLDFSAALETGGWVDTWGNQANGRLGNGSTAAGSRKFSGRVKTSSTVELAGIRDIALGKDFAMAREACALETAGALGQVWVWGNNATGNLALGNTTAQSYAIKSKLNATTDLTDVWDVDAGDDFAAVVRWKSGDTNLQGSVWTFGNRVNSSLGDNGIITGTATYPVQVQKLVGAVYSPLAGIQQISCGPKHTLALDNTGNVWAWGNNTTGALGDNTTVTKKYAIKVRNPGNTADLTNIARVSAGGINGSPAFSSAIAKDGTIYVWGSNANGLLANGTTSTTVFAKLPVVVAQLKTIPGFPTVSLASAVTTTNVPGAATLTATVADPQGAATISKTEFYVQGVLSSTRTASPWTASLTNLAQGNYSAYAKTTDADGNETTSLATSFNIAASLDSDSDGLLDSWEVQKFGNINQTATGDPDNDKVNNLDEYTAGSNPNSKTDANADGIPDDWVVWRLSQAGGVAASTLPATGDPDQDELTNLVEYQNNTHPRLLDSDADGQSDWQEAAQGTDANDASSLVQPLAVSSHQRTSNLLLSQTLTNPSPATSYDLSLSGNIPPTAAYELKSSNVAGGPAYEWIDISTTGENLTAFKTAKYDVVQRPIGFSFPFYGTSYTELFITGQGYVTLIDPSGGFPHDFRAPLPNAAGSRTLIAPYEQYLEPNVLGNVYFKSFATYTVVQWEQIKLFGFDSRPTFQAVIYADGSIRFNYKSIPLTSGGLWIWGYLSGIQYAAGDSGIAASWYTTSQQGLALHSMAPVSLRFSAPTVTPAPWVSTTTPTASGNPLSWTLNFQASGLQPGNRDAVLQLRKNVTSPVLYSRTIRLTVLPLGSTGNDILEGTPANDSLAGLDGNDTLNGNSGADNLLGGGGNDLITGGADNDVLDGGDDDDTLSGNSGDDVILGGRGKDVYRYALGEGNDTYTDYAGIHQADDSTADYSDLYFGVGISPGMLRSRYLSSAGALKFEIQHASGGSITITDWNAYSESTGVYVNKRWRFHFEDGTVWDGGLFWSPTQDGWGMPYEGVTGGNLAETIIGTSGSDRLRGLLADDELIGCLGLDRYDYRWGDGRDVIEDTFEIGTPGDISVLDLDPSVLRMGHLSFQFVPPQDLRIDISNPSNLSKNGSVLIRNWFRTSPVVERTRWRIRVGDGSGGTVDAVDRDIDGMMDAWETANGLNPAVDDSLNDFDGDRIPNIFELRRGTNPNDVNDAPQPTFVVDPTNGELSTTDNIHSSINGALLAVASSDANADGQPDPYPIILVKGGTYAENVVLNAVPILLLGELGSVAGPVRIAPAQTGVALTIASPSVVDGIIVSHQQGTGGTGVLVSNSIAAGDRWPSAKVRRGLVNCIVDCSSASAGIGVAVSGECDLDLVHCTVIGNADSVLWPAVQLTHSHLNLINSVIYDTMGMQHVSGRPVEIDATSAVTAEVGSPSIVSGIPNVPTLGWIYGFPELSAGGYVAGTYSAVVDRGGLYPNTKVLRDIHGQFRPSGSKPDIGADEFIQTGPITETFGSGVNPNVIDMDGDGIPDQWETANGLNPLLPNPGSDLQNYLSSFVGQAGLQIHTLLQ